MQIRQIHLVAWGEMRDVGLPVSYFQQILWESMRCRMICSFPSISLSLTHTF